MKRGTIDELKLIGVESSEGEALSVMIQQNILLGWETLVK